MMLRDKSASEELALLKSCLGEKRAEIERLENLIEACGTQPVPTALRDALTKVQSAVMDLGKREYCLELEIKRGTANH